MGVLKWLLVFNYFLWMITIVSALLNPTLKSLIPVIVGSTSVIVGALVIKDD